MNILDDLLDKALRMNSSNRASRRARERLVVGPDRKAGSRSSRICSVCGQPTPTFRLVTPPGRAQICTTCRDQELKGEVV